MALKLDTWYPKTGTNVINTNTAGIDYKVTRTSAQELANQSQIEIKPWIMKTVTYGAYDYNDATMTIKCSGQTKTTVIDYDLNDSGYSENTKFYLTTSYPFRRISGSSSPYTYIVDHNADGTLSSVNLYAFIPLANSGSGENHVVDINVELPSIPRGSVLGTIPNFTFDSTEGNGVEFSVPYTKYFPSYYNILDIYINGFDNDGTRVASILDEAYASGTVTFDSTALNTIYNAMASISSMEFTFVLWTYSDDTYNDQVGYASVKTAMGSISSEGIAPTFSENNITYCDTNESIIALTGDPQTIVRRYSNPDIKIDVKAEANKGAILGTNCYEFASSGQTTVYGSQNESLPIVKRFTNVTSKEFTVSAEDSRKNTTSNTKAYITFLEYEDPDIESVVLSRDNSIETNTKIEINGEIWNKNFGITENSIIGLTYQYKETTASTYIQGTTNLLPRITYDSSTGKFSLIIDTYINGDKGTDGTDGFDINKSYYIQVTVTDRITSYTYNAVLSAGIPGTYLKKFYDNGSFDGYGLGIGMKPTAKGLYADFGVLASGGSNISGSLLKIIYPVGSVYMSVNSTNPKYLFGGTWVQLKNKFLLGAGSTYQVNAAGESYTGTQQDGGAATHTLTVAQMPNHSHTGSTSSGGSHTHPIRYKALTANDGGYVVLRRTHADDSYDGTDGDSANSAGAHLHTFTTDTMTEVGQAHNNLPPYLVVYMWKRTA